MKTREKDPVSSRAEKSLTEEANPTSQRARELREYVERAPTGGTYQTEQGRDERVVDRGAQVDESAPADTRSEVAEKYEP
ncbi:MAG: hypothetical protein KF767_16670 [Bdellovibrionaceae bacterium]|nr:hypothetical protein [Pseudobdellovibrionaceae bacterium]